ncbi:MAG: SMP-30/gluconolactonase/LRE family protein [Actinomycetota bacterium]
MVNAEPITDPVTYHGEGPFWDEGAGRLLCMDVLNGSIIEIGPTGRVVRYQCPSPVVTVIRRRVAGGFVLAVERGVVVTDARFSQFEEFAELSLDPGVRSNDGGCDSSGNFVIGTMAYDERSGGGTVYRVTPDRQVVELVSPVSISNGVQWSHDGLRAFYIDSPTRRIDVFDVDPQTGDWSGRRPHIAVRNAEGVPDGMAIDEEGGLWVALWGAGAVNHYDEAGLLVERIQVPGISQVSSCAFGGSRRNVLYITTSRLGLSDGCEPDAGAVFAVQTGSRGAPQGEFGG